MTCFHPLTIHLKRNYPIDFKKWTEKEQHSYNKPLFKPQKDTYAIQVPCGRCIGCRLDKANKEWATRIYCESELWKNNLFLTLTYNEHGIRKEGRDKAGEANLPRTQNGKPTLRLEDLQNFMKRLRDYCINHEKELPEQKEWINPVTGKREKPVRYFACGEYGEKNGRPHYHMALFNFNPGDLKFYKFNKNGDALYTSKILSDIWGHGFVIIGSLTQKSACYIARYTQKKVGLKPNKKIWLYDDKKQEKHEWKSTLEPKKEFIVMSRGCGIGRAWWDEQKDFVKKWGYISIKIDGTVKRKPLPRYFKKLWENEDWEGYHIQRYENIKKAILQANELEKQENYQQGDTEYLSRLKRERELLQKAQSLKRNNFI